MDYADGIKWKRKVNECKDQRNVNGEQIRVERNRGRICQDWYLNNI